MQTGIDWHSNWLHFLIDQIAYVSHYSSHFSLFYSEHCTAWGLITKIRCLHWSGLLCTTQYLIVCAPLPNQPWLALRSRLLNKSVGSICVEAGVFIVKGTRMTIAQEKVLKSTIYLFLDFTISSWILCLSVRLSELRPESQLNNLNFPVKITPPALSLSLREPWEPLGKWMGSSQRGGYWMSQQEFYLTSSRKQNFLWTETTY